MDSTPLAAAVASDFLVPGISEPIVLHPSGVPALLVALRLASAIGALEESIDALLGMTYLLDGREDSPSAARAIRDVMIESAEVRSALALSGDRRDHRRLEDLAKKRIRRGESLRATKDTEHLDLAIRGIAGAPNLRRR